MTTETASTCSQSHSSLGDGWKYECEHARMGLDLSARLSLGLQPRGQVPRDAAPREEPLAVLRLLRRHLLIRLGGRPEVAAHAGELAVRPLPVAPGERALLLRPPRPLLVAELQLLAELLLDLDVELALVPLDLLSSSSSLTWVQLRAMLAAEPMSRRRRRRRRRRSAAPRPCRSRADRWPA